MEEQFSTRLEDLRRKVEKLEDEYDKQEEWKVLLNDLNEVKIKVYAAGVFSENEEFKEIKTEDIKYLLISFYQAEVIQKFSENRENILAHALQFYKEFYNILNKYEYLTKDRKIYYKKITKQGDEEEEGRGKPSLEEMSKEREEKILAFKYKKALSDKLKKIEKEKSYDDNREYWVSYLEMAWLKMIENIKMINMELDSIKFIKQQKKTGEYERQLELDKQNQNKKMEILQFKSPEDLQTMDPNNKLMKNLNIVTTSTNPNCTQCIPSEHTIPTLDSLIDKQIFSRDYVFRSNNLPTMTLDEFATKEKQRMDEQKLMEEEAKKNAPNDDSDDEEVADMKTYKAREWDDWKDLNEKGSGNRKKR